MQRRQVPCRGVHCPDLHNLLQAPSQAGHLDKGRRLQCGKSAAQWRSGVGGGMGGGSPTGQRQAWTSQVQPLCSLPPSVGGWGAAHLRVAL